MRRSRWDWALLALLGAVSYLPLLLSRPGQVAADTKQYLYLDPSRLTSGARSMWDPGAGLGTVTHQNIGYLFPMGPYYTAVHALGVPMWVGQRVWMGTLMLLAGTGVAYCCRRLGLDGLGRAVAALAYALTPYTLDYLDRASAIVMPWAALGWMVGLCAVAARRGRWRHPALFALVVALVGGVNATSILLVLVAPGCWLLHSGITGEVPWKRIAAAAGRIALLSTAVSLWWAAGLWAEGRYGINILRVTETVPTVARTSSAAEVLRGLGYWYFYGWDKVQPWTMQAPGYTQTPWLIVVSFAVPGLSIGLGLLTRWAYRSFCLLIVGVGTVVAVGAYPYTRPSFLGRLIEHASAGSTVALAMRSVDRIVPLVVLGLALLMGSGVTALQRWRPTAGYVSAVATAALIAADLPALWTGGMIASNLVRPSAIPAYWTAAVKYLDSSGSGTRVLGLPGEDFGAYSWGVTEDPLPPGVLQRPYVSRQVVPAGTPASANLVQALDEPIQEGTFDFSALAPIARLMGVGDVLLQSDLQYERYHLPLPQVLAGEMNPPPAGLGAPINFGRPNVARPIRYPLENEARLGLATGTPDPPSLSVFPVSDPRPLLRLESGAAPMVVAGDGEGLVEAASAGLIDSGRPLVYAATASRTAGFLENLPPSSPLVLTDTNPLAYDRWGSLRDNIGQVEQPGVADPSVDPSYYSLPLFPGETTADQTVAQVSGLRSVVATAYGDSLSFTPENRPLNAFDGDPASAWTYGAHAPASGATITARLVHPVTTGQVVLHQFQMPGPVKRRIQTVTLRFDGRDPVTVALASSSLAGGQKVSFPVRTFSTFSLTVDRATGGAGKRYDGLPPVGFTEIGIPGVGPAVGTLRLPTDLLSSLGPASASHPLAVLMQRSRAVEPPRHDPEPSMRRTFVLPTARTFAVGGTAEINTGDSDYLINQLIGLTPAGPLPAPTDGPVTVVAANSSTRLVGDRRARANAAADGDPETAWIAESGPQAGEWLSLTLNHPVTFDHLDLQVVADGRHSIPTRITISTDEGDRTVDLPPVGDGRGRPSNAVTAVRVAFPAITGRNVKVTIDSIRKVTALDYYSTFTDVQDILPVGIAELGVPGVAQPAPPAAVPTVCSAGLLAVDGHPVDLAVTGSTADALAGRQLRLQPCGNSVAGVHLAPGPHTIETSQRLPLGWSIDQLRLSSPGAAPLPPAAPLPAVRSHSNSRTDMTVTVPGGSPAGWLVLGESYSDGWTATAGGHSLGRPVLMDGFANGWRLPATPAGHGLVVHIRWAPQRVIDGVLALSGTALIACMGLALWPGSGAAREGPGPPDPAGPEGAAWRTFAGFDRRRRPRGWPLAVTSVAYGLAVAVVSRPVIGVGAGLLAALGMTWWPGRLLARVGGLLALGSLPVYAVMQQVGHHYWPTIDWPGDLSAANDLAWLGLALIGADLAAGAGRRLYAGRVMEAADSDPKRASP